MKALIQLIIQVRNGDSSAFENLCEQYKPLILSMVNKFLLSCEEDNREDLLQEAKLALYDAILTFDVNQTAVSFGFYAKRCIRNRLTSYVRKLHSKKRQKMIEIDDEQERETPQDAILQNEILSLAKDVLSDYEMKILEMYISGLRAKEISAATGRSEKSVNNAIYRIRSKLKKIINGGT